MRTAIRGGATNSAAFQAIEAGNSDNDPSPSSNLTEIFEDTQPGWTIGPNNLAYFKNGTIQEDQEAPSGILGSLDPTPPNYSIGGSVSGLSGQGLVLQNNGNDDLNINQDGAFEFSSPLPDLSDYEVKVKTQPDTPSQTCSVSNGSGSLNGSDITNVHVNCVINQFTVGGTVTGLEGSGLSLNLEVNQGDEQLHITSNGLFAFKLPIADLSLYEVTVLSTPINPTQTCTITNGFGPLNGADVTNVEVSCLTDSYTLGGSVSGLSGQGLVLQNNGNDDLNINQDGAFEFSSPLPDLSDYEVKVKTQPDTPSQTCSVSNGSGSLNGSDITSVHVNCVINQFTVGGTVTGLEGSGLILQINGGDDEAIVTNGEFEFDTAINDASIYAVTVKNQPSDPQQLCSVAAATGSLSGFDVSNVVVTCAENAYKVGGSVTGLTGSGLILQNNGGDDEVIAVDGQFEFDTALADGSGYAVTVGTQPSEPPQTCSVSNGSGSLLGSDVTDVAVNCVDQPLTETIFKDGFETPD